MVRVFQFLSDLGRVSPVARALIVGQQRQPGLRLEGRSFQHEQGRLSPVKQAGLEVVQRQRVLRPVAVSRAQVATREQVFMHTHGAFIFATTAKQVAQREVKLGRVRITLDRFNEGVYGLVLLLVEQKIQAFEIGFGCPAVFHAHLAQIESGREPTQHKRHR